jgi:phage/plasmid-associated DNA primase
LGSVLLGCNRAQRILLLTGTAGGGKGTLMEIIEHLVGLENVAQLRTEQLAERFELGRIVGRTLLCGKDVDANFLQEKGAHVLKAIVGHDLQTGERKGANSAVNFRGDFAVAIVANSRLRVRLQGDANAWRRRLISIDYVRPKPASRIENFARLLLKEESSGILRWGIEGAVLHKKELEEHGDFQLTQAQLHRVDALLSESDSLRRFGEERLAVEKNSDLTVSEIVEAYSAYCDHMNWTPLPENAVQRQLPDIMLDLFGAARRQDIRRDGRAQRGFKGVALLKQQ